jgi:opacity protein-like surface antigen
MVKQIGMVLLSTVLGSSLYAGDMSESQKFIGVEVSISEVQGDGPSDIATNISNGTSFGLRLGAQNDEWRTMIGLTYFDAEGRNVERLYGSVDYLFLPSDISDSLVFKPFIGMNVGYQNYESNEIDEDGFVYGGQAGVIINAFDNLSVDVSYRYTLSNEVAFDHSGDVVFGFNYNY